MFNTPTRHHISFVIERLGVLFFFIAYMGLSSTSELLDYVSDPNFLQNLQASAVQLATPRTIWLSAALLLVVLVILGISLRAWRKTTFHIEDDFLVYHKNTLYQRHSRLPIQNIATVNINRSLLERVLGTSKVSVDINAANSEGSADYIFYLKQEVAVQLRDTLMQHKQILLDGAPALQTAAPQTAGHGARVRLAQFTVWQALRHQILSLPVVQSAYIAFLTLSPFFGVNSGYAPSRLISVLILAAVLVLARALWGTLNLADYIVECDDTHIYLQYGMLKKSNFTFAKKRVHAVRMDEPLLARVLHLCAVELAVVGFGNQKRAPHICLLTTKAHAMQILQACAPQFSACEGERLPAHKAAYLPVAGKTLLLFLGALLYLYVAGIPYFWLAGALLLVVCGFGAVLNVKTKTLRYGREGLHYTTGVFNKKTGMLRYDNMQQLRLQSNRVTLRLRAAKAQVSILADAGMRLHSTGWFPLAVWDEIAHSMVKQEAVSDWLLFEQT